MRARFRAAELLVVIMLASAAATGSARAEQPGVCEPGGRPWLSVVFMGQSFGSALAASVLADLRAGLALRGIAVCAFGSAGSEPPLGLLELKAMPGDRVAVSIELHDALTEKRVQRDLDVREVAQDARALLIADAADELLRASWAELAIADAPAPARPAPPAIERAVRSSLAPAQIGARDRTLGARGGFEYHAGGAELAGAELAFGSWFGERLGAELAFGLYEGWRVRAQHGAVDVRALLGAFDATLALGPRSERVAFALKLGLMLGSVTMRGSAGARATGRAAAALDVHARSGVVLVVALSGALALRADAGIGVPLRSVRASDAGSEVMSTGGVQLFASLGPEVRF